MKVLGFYIGGHDSNVSLVNENGLVRYYKLERLVQQKHKKGSLDWVRQLCEKESFRPDVICFSDGNRNDLGICDEGRLFQRVNPLRDLFDVETYCMDHHYAHILSAWCANPGAKRANIGVCIDGRGDHLCKCSVISSPFDIARAKFVYQNKEQAFGLMFNRIGNILKLQGGELDFAGKIMGLHAYGVPDRDFINCNLTEQNYWYPERLFESTFRGKLPEQLDLKEEQRIWDWVASMHEILGKNIARLFRTACDEHDVIVYAGGTAQNTVYNEMLLDLYPDLIIPPHCYDGGLSLGCVGLVSLLKKIDLYISDFPFSQDMDDVRYASENTIDRVAELLNAGKIVGWCQGRAEIGPRALGHRSLLMNPAIAGGKDILNNRVKKREPWRPYAASILLENSEDITGKYRMLPYMLHAVKVEPKYHDMFASVVHEDGTCRFQTVDDSIPLKTYRKLIERFEEKSGVRGVLNTSLNLGGKPIVSSAKDAEELFYAMDIDAICIGDELLVK